MEYHKKLEEKLEMLKKENQRLEDENASLWFWIHFFQNTKNDKYNLELKKNKISFWKYEIRKVRFMSL